MMNKIERVKRKLAKRSGLDEDFKELASVVKKQKIATHKFLQAVEDRAVKKVLKAAQGKLLEKAERLVSDVQSILEENNNGIDKVVAYLEAQEKHNQSTLKDHDAIYHSVLASLKELANNTQKVIVTNQSKGLTKADVLSAFKESLETVKNVLLSQNEEPESVNITYTNAGKMAQMRRNFGKFSLLTNFQYNEQGKVSGWQTKKV